MKPGRPNLESNLTPYFSRNRDETDTAYQSGWDVAAAGKLIGENPPSFQKETLVKAYRAGFLAFIKAEYKRLSEKGYEQ